MTMPGARTTKEYVTTSLRPAEYAFLKALALEQGCGIAMVLRTLVQQAYEQEQKRLLAAQARSAA